MNLPDNKLYSLILAALQGTLIGLGMLGMVLLCESLLSYLLSGQRKDQPTDVFRAYNILPLGNLHLTRKIDLCQFPNTRIGELYVRQPRLQKLWIPTSSLSSSVACRMLPFLNKLLAGSTSELAVTRAATIISLCGKWVWCVTPTCLMEQHQMSTTG